MSAYGAFLSLVLVVSSSVAFEPKCTRTGHQIIPKPDCKGYYLCVFGRPVEMPDCPPGSTFSRAAHVCVPANNEYADCVDNTVPIPPDNAEKSIEEQCQVRGRTIPHPAECQIYYNCSVRYDRIPRYFEQHMQECRYPELFNDLTGQCDHFENVKCGNRKEFKNGCDYRGNQCHRSHCIPCNIRYPSCEGKANGMHAHEVKRWSPFYVMCYKERMIAEKECEPGEDGRNQIYHPELNECVSLEQIPKAHGGMMPDCTGLTDGFYLDDFGRCDRYTVCMNGKFLNQVKCQAGETFDAYLDVCTPAEETCGPCGNRDDC